MNKNIPVHSCKEHLNSSCRCSVCGSVHHMFISDSEFAGQGRVNVACLRCKKTAAYYNDTGGIIHDDFDEKNHSLYGGIIVTCAEIVEKMRFEEHNCREYKDEQSGICLLCGKRTTAKL